MADYPRTRTPAVTRSQLVLEMTYEMIRNPRWRANQAKIMLREAGGHKPWEFTFFGSDAHLARMRAETTTTTTRSARG